MAKQTLEAVFYRGDDQDRMDYTPSGADAGAHTVVNLGSGLTGIVTSPEGIADGVLGSVATRGTFKITKDDGGAVNFARCAKVGWDDTAKEAVVAGTGDWDIGICEEAAVNGDDHVKVALNRDQVD